MGAGKTTIGRLLAKRLHRHFVDCDHEIEARTGVRIPVIFEIEGETGFRRRETQVLDEIAAEKNLVVATGGGIVLAEANRRRLRESGVVIYLRATPEVLHRRTRRDRNRPLLQVDDPLAKLRELYALRDPLYREVADVVIESEDAAASTVAQRIQEEVETRCEP